MFDKLDAIIVVGNYYATAERMPHNTARLGAVRLGIVKMTKNQAKPIMCNFLFRSLYPLYVCQHHINCTLSRLIKMGLYC